MAAVFGLVDFARPAHRSPRKVVQDIARIHGSTLAEHVQLYADGWLGLGYLPERFQTHPAANVIFTDDRIVAFIEGEVLNRASVAASSRIPLELMKQLSLPELMGRAFEHRGPGLFEELDGSFRIVIWDYIDKKLYIVADRIGFRPFFYVARGDRLFFASQVKSLLQGLDTLPGLNPQAIADFLRFGYILNEDTYFKGIIKVPAGHYLLVEENRASILNYVEDTAFTSRETILDKKEAISLLRNTALTGVKAYSDFEPTGILLSGGLDSRLIATAQRRLGYPITTVTVGAANSAEVHLANQVAFQLQSDHHVQELTAELYLDNFRRATWLSDGLLNGNHAHLLSTLPFLKNHPIRLLVGIQPLAGLFRMAELMFWQFRKWDLPLQLGLAERLFHPVYRPDEAFLPAGKIFREELYPNILSTDERLKDLVAKLDFAQLSPAEAIQTLNKKIRIRNLIALQTEILRHYVRVCSPLYTFAYLEVVSRFPEKWQSGDKTIMRYIIQDLNSQIAAIPWERNMLPLGVSKASEYMWLAARFLNQHFKFYQGDRYENSPLIQQPMFDFLAHLEQSGPFRQGLKYLLFDLLPDEIINRHAVKKLITFATKYKLHVEEILTRIMTINLWYYFFVQGHKPSEEICNFSAWEVEALQEQTF